MQRAFNSTIKIKKKLCKSCKQEKYIFSRGRCADCSRQEDNKDQEAEVAGESLVYLISDLDTLCSLIVRMKDANENGMNECYTCNSVMDWKQLQAGHYMSRRNMFLRWDFRNLKPQCNTCNVIKHGNLSSYGKRLEMEHPGITEILLEESRIVQHWSRDELKGMAVEFNRQLSMLKNKFK